MFSKLLLCITIALAALPSVLGHGRLAKPTTRGIYAGKYEYQENAPVPSNPLDSAFVCRNDPAPPSDKWVTVNAGGQITLQWSLTAAHVGDCAVYITYDANVADSQKKWFKIANLPSCKDQNGQPVNITLPSYLLSCDHCILRWEWYALHVRPIVEFYAQCVDIKINGNRNGGMPSPMVTIPGHLPANANNGEYRDPFNPSGNQFITGPKVASFNGNTGTSSSSSSSSTTTETVKSTTGSSVKSTTGSQENPGTDPSMCVLGTSICKANPGSSADYQCCASGATCHTFGSAGVCCGPSTTGCVYGNNQSTCCDSRYLKCDSDAGCVAK